jgi:CheY-like chemotaxis protein
MSFDGLLDSPKFSGAQPLKILLVDDEPATLQLVRRLLQADGHDIYEAIDGEQAVQMFDASSS